jgi:hypothetical protein
VIEAALPDPGRRQRLAVACVENAEEVGPAVAAAAIALQRRGRTVDLVDLTEVGGLAATVATLAAGAGDRPRVHRPEVVPSLASGPEDLAAEGTGPASSLGYTGVCLVLAEVDPRVGADHLTRWTERVLVAVTAGRSGVDRVRTTAELLRGAGLQVVGALVTRTSADDVTSGLYSVSVEGAPDSTGDQAAGPGAGVTARESSR